MNKYNYEFIINKELNYSNVESCLHILSSIPNELVKTYKYIEKNYNEKSVNIYMIMKCMESLLPKDQKKDFVKLINIEIKQLNSKLKSIKIDNILNIMGFYKNN